MKRVFLFLFCSALIAAGCNKNKQDVANADEVTPPATEEAVVATKPSSTEVAKGEMRELLLALKRVHFPFDSSTLVPESRRALDEAAEKLRNNRSVELWVDGHTDARGTTEYNMSLSERRARTVMEYLQNSGVEKPRLSVVSFGEEKPLVEKTGDEANALNRRVEFRLMRGDVQLVLEEGPLLDDEGQTIDATEEPPAKTTATEPTS